MIRVIVSILLIGTAVLVGAFATLGLQGKMMRKPPMELFPDMDRQAKLRPSCNRGRRASATCCSRSRSTTPRSRRRRQNSR